MCRQTACWPTLQKPVVTQEGRGAVRIVAGGHNCAADNDNRKQHVSVCVRPDDVTGLAPVRHTRVSLHVCRTELDMAVVY